MADSQTYMPVAVRAFTERADPNKEPDDSETDGDDDGKTKGGRRPAPLPEGVLVFDTETTVDETQRLNFGAWRYLRAMWPETGEPRLCCVEEGLFYSDDLPERDPRGYRTLCAYAERERPQVDRGEWDAAWHLPLVPAREFTEEVLHRTAHRARCWVVGFNLPFDLSRLATAVSTSQQYLAGGFSLVLIDYEKDGERRENQWRARLAIKSLDSKRQLIGFKKPAELDEVDQIPDEGGKPDPKNTPRGNFLDVRTLAFALTDRSYSLRSACEEFGTTPKKQGTEAHGRITPRYVGYCRNDVAATTALFGRLMGEYRTHPIALSATKAYSPASVGKAYLKAMGVRPVLKRQPRFDRSVLGHSMVAYYGGRTEVRIRKTVVPVVYVDFLSMYPTVCSDGPVAPRVRQTHPNRRRHRSGAADARHSHARRLPCPGFVGEHGRPGAARPDRRHPPGQGDVPPGRAGQTASPGELGDRRQPAAQRGATVVHDPRRDRRQSADRQTSLDPQGGAVRSRRRVRDAAAGHVAGRRACRSPRPRPGLLSHRDRGTQETRAQPKAQQGGARSP
jgi:hypothetical protein